MLNWKSQSRILPIVLAAALGKLRCVTYLTERPEGIHLVSDNILRPCITVIIRTYLDSVQLILTGLEREVAKPVYTMAAKIIASQSSALCTKQVHS